MPRYAHAQLRWSEPVQRYLIFIDEQATEQSLCSDWLEQIASFAFHSRWGMHYTVRRQRAQRGGSYWYAYRRLHGRIVKRYIGRSADLTLARLEEIAHRLEGLPNVDQHALESSEAGQTAGDMTLAAAQVEDGCAVSSSGTAPLLFSKLSAPRLQSSLLDRSRLFALLDAGREGAFTLVTAPAGCGKTTLVCQWLAARRIDDAFPPVGWISLEASDNDPLRFWRYLIAACQAFQVDLQEAQNALLAMTPQPPFLPSSFERVLTSLLNALARSLVGGTLVLEDYHAASDPTIHETLSFFIDHLPATFHLIMITRSDPPFSLARLRTRGALLCEVRASDLRFSLDETTSFLHRFYPFDLVPLTIQRFQSQIQGWAAGLHLMKLALQRATTQAQGEQAVALFSRNASLQEYFVAEVLDSQAEEVQRFVLQTSLLTRLTGPLCDAVTGQSNGQDMLKRLENGNLFLEALDDAVAPFPLPSTQQWYRYHALFAEAMRAEARQRLGTDHLRQLSARASDWYEMHGFLHEAIEAALAGGVYERAANLVARSIEEHTFPGEIHEPHTLRRWLEQIPASILEQKPVLCLSYATTLLFQSVSWQPDALALPLLQKLLHIAEHGFRSDNNVLKAGEVLAFRSLLALRQGDTQASISYARQALDGLAQTQSIWRGLSLCIVAEEWIRQGNFQQAQQALLESQKLCEAAGNRYFRRIAQLKLAQVSFEQGKFQYAASLYRQTLGEARKEGPAYVCASALLGLATICYASNDLDDAYRYAQDAVSIGQAHYLLYYEVRAMLVLARVQQAQQDQLVVAQQQLTALLDRVPVSLPYLRQEIQTALARLAFLPGDQMTIQRWAIARIPQPDFVQEKEEELLLCRWLRSQGKPEEASSRLDALLDACRKAGHVRGLLEAQVEMVLLAAALKRKAEAQRLLRKVLAQAFDGNVTRLFLDAGEQMAILLRTLLPQLHEQALQAYIRTLLHAFPAHSHSSERASFLIEPLSPQEMRVLRLLVQHRSNADIARELVVSVNTVRTHVQSIYSKLGVHTRGAASDVARELRLIS